jgi:hypothetical protein
MKAPAYTVPIKRRRGRPSIKGPHASKRLQTEDRKLSKGIPDKMLAEPLGRADTSASSVPVTIATAENGEQHFDPKKASAPNTLHSTQKYIFNPQLLMSKDIPDKMLAGSLGQTDSSVLLVPFTTAIEENGEPHFDPKKASAPDILHPYYDQNDQAETIKSNTEIMLCAHKLFPKITDTHSCLTVID